MSSTRNQKYQEGSIERVKRAKGPDVWVYRYWETVEGATKPKHRSKLLGSVKDLPRLSDARREADNKRAEINAKRELSARKTIRDVWGHFQLHELRDPEVDRSPTTIDDYLECFKNRILPHWGDVAIEDVKPVAVEKWLRSLSFSPGTKAKIRSRLSSLFSHCIRHDIYKGENPLKTVRQGAKRRKDPDILTIEEIYAILSRLDQMVFRVMILTFAATGLRRSELRGLKWSDLDFEKLWFNLCRGLVRKHVTKMKTEASRKGMPMMKLLAEVLKGWRAITPYPSDDDWVFASPYTDGKSPYWMDVLMEDHIRPAAVAAGVTKHVTWHVFRHSLATLLGRSGVDIKVVQELMRHSSPRITMELYQQAHQDDKREALDHTKGLFLISGDRLAS